jgi:hypothetical protein
MQEVQFISDLTINMINGLSDFSATAIDKFYRENDTEFPQMDDMRKRMDGLFAKLVLIPFGACQGHNF